MFLSNYLVYGPSRAGPLTLDTYVRYGKPFRPSFIIEILRAHGSMPMLVNTCVAP